jgi:hypothetical protein
MDETLKTQVVLATSFVKSLHAKHVSNISPDMKMLFDEYSSLHKQLQMMQMLPSEGDLWTEKVVQPKPSGGKRMTKAYAILKSKKCRRLDITPKTSRQFRHLELENRRFRRALEKIGEAVNELLNPSDNDSLNSDHYDDDEEEEEEEEEEEYYKML